MHPFMGPWRIVASLPGSSYALEFATDPKHWDKKHASDLSPYPPRLIHFEWMDGADNRYGQLYKRIGCSPCKEVGTKGFKPLTPFPVASHFACQGNLEDFHFPTLAKLNNDFEPFPWVDKVECIRFFADNVIKDKPVMYTGPPPLPVDLRPPSFPPISSLVASIIASLDRLLFVSHSLGNPSIRKWRLICVALLVSTSLSPSCLQDGCFLVEFYSLHHEDVQFKATKQQYWLQYHSIGTITTPTSSTTTHLIWPSDTSEALATK
jgi:hypothetical protein